MNNNAAAGGYATLAWLATDANGLRYVTLHPLDGESMNCKVTELVPRSALTGQATVDAFRLLAWFAANPYDYRQMTDKSIEAAAFLAANNWESNG